MRYESQRNFFEAGDHPKVSLAAQVRALPAAWSSERKRKEVFTTGPQACCLLADIEAGPRYDGVYLPGNWPHDLLVDRWRKFVEDIPSLESYARATRLSGTSKNGKVSPLMREAHLWYEHYLGSDHWQSLRRLAREHYVNCAVCASGRDLDTHHKNANAYERLGAERVPEDVSLLCRDCHDLYHTHSWLGVPEKPTDGAKDVLSREGIGWQ